MSKVDGRKIPYQVREQMRFEAIKNWLSGMNPSDLARKYGTSRKIVYEWIDRYECNGWDGLKTRTGKTGPKPRLSPEQKKKLRLILTTQTPVAYGYETTLWTSQIIARLIEQVFAVKYVSGSVGKLLKTMGFSTQNSRWGTWEQDKKN